LERGRVVWQYSGRTPPYVVVFVVEECGSSQGQHRYDRPNDGSNGQGTG